MKNFAPAGLLLLGLLAFFFHWRKPAASRPSATPPSIETRSTAPHAKAANEPAHAHALPVMERPALAPLPRPTLSADEKALRVGKINHDYAAIRLTALRAYGEAGEAFPGGSHTLQRQLALLEREKRADLAAVLDSLELEDLELRETGAGQMVAFRLGATAATEEQRRAVFRLQREFDLRFGGVIDTTPEVFSEREKAQRELQERIRGVLGESLVSAWLPPASPVDSLR